jgi:hypothetical protein
MNKTQNEDAGIVALADIYLRAQDAREAARLALIDAMKARGIKLLQMPDGVCMRYTPRQIQDAISIRYPIVDDAVEAGQ